MTHELFKGVESSEDMKRATDDPAGEEVFDNEDIGIGKFRSEVAFVARHIRNRNDRISIVVDFSYEQRRKNVDL